jgi:hypothetical protein
MALLMRPKARTISRPTAYSTPSAAQEYRHGGLRGNLRTWLQLFDAFQQPLRQRHATDRVWNLNHHKSIRHGVSICFFFVKLYA